MMGGRIWATNRPEGGAEFGFFLPEFADDVDDAGEAGWSVVALGTACRASVAGSRRSRFTLPR